MKKTIPLLVLSFLLFSSLNAQSQWNYGLKLGITSSDIKLNDKRSSSMYAVTPYYEQNAVNPALSLFVSKRLSNHLGLETDLAYIEKGYRTTQELLITTPENPSGDGTQTDYTYGIETGYLSLGTKLHPIINIENLGAYGIIGVSINYNLFTTELPHLNIENLIFSYDLGIGIDIQDVINYPLFIEVKYSEDFSDFYSNDYYSLKNRVLIFSVGLNLNRL